jgi:hypothetical protein
MDEALEMTPMPQAKSATPLPQNNAMPAATPVPAPEIEQTPAPKKKKDAKDKDAKDNENKQQPLPTVKPVNDSKEKDSKKEENEQKKMLEDLSKMVRDINNALYGKINQKIDEKVDQAIQNVTDGVKSAFNGIKNVFTGNSKDQPKEDKEEQTQDKSAKDNPQEESIDPLDMDNTDKDDPLEMLKGEQEKDEKKSGDKLGDEDQLSQGMDKSPMDLPTSTVGTSPIQMFASSSDTITGPDMGNTTALDMGQGSGGGLDASKIVEVVEENPELLAAL